MAIRRKRSKPFFRKRGPEHKINDLITAIEVRLVGEGIEPGVYSIEKALELSKGMGLDLVEISPKAVPPVCKVINYQKFLYEKKKKDKEIKAKTQKTVIKEIRFTPHTDEHDLDFKAKHAENFLKEGAKVKAYVQFKGRAIIFKDKGYGLLEKFIEKISDFGKVEQEPKFEGRRISMFIAPYKSKKK